MKHYRQLIILLLLTFFPVTLLGGAAEAGKFLFVFGKVDLELADGTRLAAKKGLPLYEGTTIRSDKTGKAQIKLVDGGFLAVRPNTHLKIDEYAFNQKGRENKGVVSLLKGTFRTISGAIAKENKEKIVVKTPIATIGIRGTDHEPAFIPANDPSFSPDLQPGVYDRVNSGFTFIENDAGRLNLGQDDVGFVAQPDQLPVRLDHVPSFFKTPNVAVTEETDSDETQEGQQEQQDGQAEVESGQGDAQPVNEQADDDSIGDITIGDDAVTTVEEIIEATDSAGNTFNLDEQTIVSADGTVTNIEDTNIGPISAHVAILKYDSSAPAFKIIEDTGFIDGTRETILRDLSGHVYGAYDEDGNHIIYGVNEASKVEGKAGDYTNNGIGFGMYTADYFADHEGIFDLGDRYVGWITGPVYQSTGLTGSTTFIYDGGLAFAGDLNGTWSQLNFNGNTQLMVDFGTNTSNLTIDVGPGGNQWVFTAAGLPLILDGTGEFDFDHPGATLNMTYNGSNVNVFADVSGSLAGMDDGAMFSFAAKQIISEPDNGVGVSGVVSFDR
jgi:hypothetical protein